MNQIKPVLFQYIIDHRLITKLDHHREIVIKKAKKWFLVKNISQQSRMQINGKKVIRKVSTENSARGSYRDQNGNPIERSA